jgi:hypothetical protein
MPLIDPAKDFRYCPLLPPGILKACGVCEITIEAITNIENINVIFFIL